MELVVTGYDVRICVRHGQLQVDHGDEHERLSRATLVRRMIILAESGFVTLDALRWCDQQGISVTQLDRTGKVVMSATSGRNDSPRIRYAQARLMPSEQVRLAKPLLRSKLYGQAANAKELLGRGDIADVITDRAYALGSCRRIDELLGLEGEAASAYWSGWVGMEVCFTRKRNLPEHWFTYRGRSTGKGIPNRRYDASFTVPAVNRGATDPVNATLNYLYALAGSECTHVCHQLGLDPDFGILHAPDANRDALSLDLLEVLRPECDRVVLHLLREPLDSRWFYEAPHGIVHVFPPLTHRLAGEVIHFARIAREYAKEISSALIK